MKGGAALPGYNGGYDSELQHYGVLGMKWGIRKDPQKAYAKASKKLDKLDKKTSKASDRITDKETKSVKKQKKADTAIIFKKRKARAAAEAISDTTKARWKYYESVNKAKKWYDAMTDAFKDTNISNLDQHSIELGKKYANMSIDNLMQETVVNASNKTIQDYYNSRGKK